MSHTKLSKINGTEEAMVDESLLWIIWENYATNMLAYANYKHYLFLFCTDLVNRGSNVGPTPVQPWSKRRSNHG